MKRILSVILSVVIIIVFCLQSSIVMANGEAAIFIENKECNPGDTVTMDVSIQNNPGIMYLELTPAFATELGEPQIQNGEIFSDFTKAKQYVWTADNNVTASGKLLSITFSIPQTTVAGNYSVGFIFRSAYDYDENPVNFSVRTGAVCVKQKQGVVAAIECEDKECNPGDTVTMDVSIKNNPGIMYLELTPAFAAELGEPSVQSTGIFSDFTKAKQYVWTADNNVTASGKLLSITFSIPQTTVAGNYSVGFIFRSAYDYDENSIRFTVKSGAIRVKEDNHIPGDINDDGKVNNKDLTRLFQHLSDWDVEVNADALDVNGDGKVNNKDLTRLFQYLSDWDVEIF